MPKRTPEEQAQLKFLLGTRKDFWEAMENNEKSKVLGMIQQTPWTVNRDDGVIKVRDFETGANGKNTTQEIRGCTPLIFAAFWGYTDLLKALLEVGANHADMTNKGMTALGFARKNGHYPCQCILKEAARRQMH